MDEEPRRVWVLYLRDSGKPGEIPTEVQRMRRLLKWLKRSFEFECLQVGIEEGGCGRETNQESGPTS